MVRAVMKRKPYGLRRVARHRKNFTRSGKGIGDTLKSFWNENKGTLKSGLKDVWGGVKKYAPSVMKFATKNFLKPIAQAAVARGIYETRKGTQQLLDTMAIPEEKMISETPAVAISAPVVKSVAQDIRKQTPNIQVVKPTQTATPTTTTSSAPVSAFKKRGFGLDQRLSKLASKKKGKSIELNHGTSLMLPFESMNQFRTMSLNPPAVQGKPKIKGGGIRLVK